jgi:protein O-mannosyl-transferase
MRTRTARRTASRETRKQFSRRPLSESAPRRSSTSTYLWCFLLAAGTLLVYAPAIFHPFINYDDSDYVTQNSHVQAGLDVKTLAWALTSTEQANWHPLTWLSHALDCQLYGLNPHGHHLTSVLFHTANVVLLFLLLQAATGATGMSAMVAALFALHPFNVESTAWIAERKNLLSMFFFLLTLAAYGRHARRPGLGRYLVVAIAFALGLSAKPMLVTLPLLLLLLDYWPLGRIQGWTHSSASFPVPQASWPRLVLEKVPLLVLSAASSVITVLAQRGGNAAINLGAVPLYLRLGNTIYSYAKYVVKIFWPVNMAVIYPHPLGKLTFAQVGVSSIFLISISVVVWHWRKRYPYAIVGWLWFLGTLVPVIGIVQVGAQGMADRYMYIPEIGIFIMLVWGLNDCAAAQPWVSQSRVSGFAIKASAVALLIGLGALTVRQIGYWSSSYSLWSHTLATTQDNFVANDELGGLLLREGKPEALQYFEAAAREAPFDPVSHGAVAASLQDRGDLQGAVREYTIALRAKDPNFLAYTYANLAIIHSLLGNDSEAHEEAERAMRYDPDGIREMVRQLAGVLQASPAAPGYLRLGLLSEVAGQSQDAKAAFQRALELDPDFTPARQALQGKRLVR